MAPKEEAETSETESHEATATGEAAPEPGAPASGDAGVWDENWGMLYRVGPDGDYEYAFSDDRVKIRPGAQWMSQEQATAAKSGAAGESESTASESSETPSPSSEGTATQSTNPPTATVTWDAQWGMFLRYADDKYEYALSGLLADAPGTDTPAGAPQGTWYATAGEATAARATVAELKDTFSDLVADPDVPISQEDLQAALQDPDFQQNLAEADAALERELAELESEG